MKVYENPGVHAFATFEEACDSALKLNRASWIMECPTETGYADGWRVISELSRFQLEFYKERGFILRAKIALRIVLAV